MTNKTNTNNNRKTMEMIGWTDDAQYEESMRYIKRNKIKIGHYLGPHAYLVTGENLLTLFPQNAEELLQKEYEQLYYKEKGMSAFDVVEKVLKGHGLSYEPAPEIIEAIEEPKLLFDATSEIVFSSTGNMDTVEYITYYNGSQYQELMRDCQNVYEVYEEHVHAYDDMSYYKYVYEIAGAEEGEEKQYIIHNGSYWSGDYDTLSLKSRSELGFKLNNEYNNE